MPCKLILSRKDRKVMNLQDQNSALQLKNSNLEESMLKLTDLTARILRKVQDLENQNLRLNTALETYKVNNGQ